MIEQYTITTPKYNFPQPTIDTPLPQRFIELSLNSLRQTSNRFFQIEPHSIYQDSKIEEASTQIQLKRQPISLSPRHQETTVSAVDTSTIKLGETSTGILIAIRGATVWKQNRKYKFQRFGPLIFHITEDNKNTVYNNLERDYFMGQHSQNRQSTPTLMQMPTRLASLLERWLQNALSRKISNALILFDGSLTSGTAETPVSRLREILTTARRNQNIVLAFSKATTLRSNGYLITDLLPNKEPPYLLETTGLGSKLPTVLLGDVYVARLDKTNLAFRLDIDHEVSFQSHVESVERLIANDALQQSYPETLRLSHILCTFTANEVLAMQHFITRKHGIRIINRPDMHRLLFGSFGREGYS